MSVAIAPLPLAQREHEYFSEGSYGAYFPVTSSGVSNTWAAIESDTYQFRLLNLAPVTFVVPLDVEFQTYAEEWKRESKFMSSPEQATALPAFRRIIGMGKPSIPYILKELSGGTSHWFEALGAITGQQPVAEAHFGNIPKMKADWIAWGRRNGLI